MRGWTDAASARRSGSESTILLVASGPGVGGGEKNLLDICRCIVADGDFAVAAVVPSPGSLREALGRLDVPVLSVPMAGLASVRSASEIARFARENGAAFIHAHGTRAAMYARVAAKRAGLRCVYTVHGLHYLNYDSAFKRLIYTQIDRYLKKRTSTFICVCESDLRKGVKAGVLDSDRSRVIYNGIELFEEVERSVVSELRGRLGIRDDGYLLLNVARFHPQKGHAYLLRAMRQIGDRCPEARLVLVGGGPTEVAMRQLAVDLGLGDSVVFAGEHGDAAPFIDASDIVIVPSLWEGLPYAVLEAMAAGKPVVASNVDGIPEAMVDGETGLLVPPRDVNELADAVTRLLDDPDLAAAMGRRARAVPPAKFSIEAMCEQTLSVYRELAEP